MSKQTSTSQLELIVSTLSLATAPVPSFVLFSAQDESCLFMSKQTSTSQLELIVSTLSLATAPVPSFVLFSAQDGSCLSPVQTNVHITTRTDDLNSQLSQPFSLACFMIKMGRVCLLSKQTYTWQLEQMISTSSLRDGHSSHSHLICFVQCSRRAFSRVSFVC